MSDHPVQLRLDDAPHEPAPADLLTPDPLIVRLNKAFFWYQGPSRWPYYLSRAEPGRAYTKSEIMEGVFMDDRRHRSAETGGCDTSALRPHVDPDSRRSFSKESASSSVSRFSERTLSATTVGAGTDAYSTSRHDSSWVAVLRHPGTNDVRVRSLLLHFPLWQCHLIFNPP